MQLFQTTSAGIIIGATLLASAFLYSSHVKSMDDRCAQFFQSLDRSLNNGFLPLLMSPISEDSPAWRMLELAESVHGVTLSTCSRR
ncbi:hypothetical protein CR158_13840 [Halomonas heilongjiangensis]|uniref:Uncharacterized protein n=1 Tax=Halomonas heilongjiangensis TaxID=1387883 RepID=A0A2N7TT53_9GAMM|nr:hypothetical protein C1H66_02775 [Halomonas heilongjiangensis]PXX88634.1 hypothetical protein CR158_13840 [Halomonas heilongjiangensis]